MSATVVVPMNVLDRARASGKLPPSLLQADLQNREDGFETALLKVIAADDFSLATGPNVVEDFQELMQTALGIDSVPGADENAKVASLVARRCIILALAGSTPSGNSTLDQILEGGFLGTVKSWMNDILKGTVGGVDLLLHLLSNITNLPVTKAVVKDSGMGKAIGSVEKNKICTGSPNESAIKGRVQAIKEAWNKSVKARKEKTPPANEHVPEGGAVDTKEPAKRSLEKEQQDATAPMAKKAKSFSSLMQKVAPGTSAESNFANSSTSTNGGTKKASAKKKSIRVKWADHFGSNLTAFKILNDGETETPGESPVGEQHVDSTVSWSDRKRRDRLREKELLATAKKSKLVDDDDDEFGAMDKKPAATVAAIQPTIGWHAPSLIPNLPPSPVANSKETLAQKARMATVKPVHYANEYAVPNSPAPLSDVEQALDMTSQSSTTTQSIPFFIPQAPVPAPVLPPVASTVAAVAAAVQAPATPTIATSEIVQSLGLPMFLVGCDVKALQNLASQPSLLSTFVDVNGMYDQSRLMTFVQTLSGSLPAHQGSIGGFQQQPAAIVGYGAPPPAHAYGSAVGGGGVYGSAVSTGGTYGPASSYGSSWQGGGGSAKSGSRGGQSGVEANLHLSGYGPTTSQAEIIALFSPYVTVTEVVMKQNFTFVNTRDPEGAERAREALNGTLLGGMPVRINMAQRKNRDSGSSGIGGAISTTSSSSYYGQTSTATPISGYGPAGGTGSSIYGRAPPPPQAPGLPQGIPPGQPPAVEDISSVRDDRGNSATKNLFVAGYGNGTSEAQLRQMFSAFGPIISVMMKNNFSFVNTTDRVVAVRAREGLMGTDVNGGRLRINFAKESGRLGTSFDLGYGSKGNPPVGNSHYGRGGY